MPAKKKKLLDLAWAACFLSVAQITCLLANVDFGGCGGIHLQKASSMYFIYCWLFLIVLSVEPLHSQPYGPNQENFVDVKKGDTLTRIIRQQFGVTEDSPEVFASLQAKIMVANRIESPKKLKVGKLFLPLSRFESATVKQYENNGKGRNGRRNVIQIKLDTDRLRNEDGNNLIDHLTDILPPTIINTKEGDTVSDLIVHYYGIGTTRPNAAAILEGKILKYNNLNRPEDLPVGAVLTPSLPSLKSDLYTDRGQVSCVQYSTLETTKINTANGNIAYADKKTMFVQNKTPIAKIIQFEADEYVLSKLERYQDIRNNATMLEGNISINLALQQTEILNPSPMLTLTEEERNLISQLLYASATRSVYLFIQDTGWPSESAYKSSYKHLFHIMDEAWSQGLKRQSPYPRTISTFQLPTNHHCIDIEASLKEFTSLDTNDRINIIYLPLTKEQGASQLLTELFQLYYLINQTSDVIALNELSQDQIAQAKKNASATVKSLPDRWSGNQIQTDVAAICAPLELSFWLGKKNHQFSFFNQSWTTPYRKIKVNFPSPLYGVVVAAVGNESTNYNIFDDNHLPDFAERCQGYPDTIGVLNVHRNIQLDPSSSDVRGIFADQAFVAGFDGTVVPGINGTSFAAPRVAWLLAAHEVLRSKHYSSIEWALALKDIVKKSRNTSDRMDKFWLRPKDFIAQ